MRHLTIANYGTFLGVSGQRLIIEEKGEVIREIALSRLRTITVCKAGIALSSALVQACALRGIRLFFNDWRGQNVAAVVGMNQHAVVALRKKQFQFIDSPSCKEVVREWVRCKLLNQRAVILYFSKSLLKANPKLALNLRSHAFRISNLVSRLNTFELSDDEQVIRADMLSDSGKVAKRVEYKFTPVLFDNENQMMVIKKGDCLWNIALKEYGRGIDYVIIFEANKSQIKDPNKIYVGQVFSVIKKGSDAFDEMKEKVKNNK